MPRIYDKINLPTNTTDIQMFAKYLKAIDNVGIVNKEDEQTLFADVKISGSRKDVQEPKRDTHTKQTLSLFGLIDIFDNDSFSVSELGQEVIKFYDSPDSHTEEERVALMLKVFMRWHIDDESYNRHMHPGYLTIKLLCDPDLKYYFTNQEYADFVMCDRYVSDDQYDDIKKHILEFRDGTGISEHVAQSKAGTFLASLVSTWGILSSSQEGISAAQKKLGDKYFKNYRRSEESTTDPEETEDTSEVVVEDIPNTELNGLSGTEKNAYAAFHTVRKYSLIGVASYIAHLFLYKQKGLKINDYYSYFTTTSKASDGLALQRIYYGAPGTGKSYMIKHDLIRKGVEPYRVTFYPDYYYSDFIGGLRPKKGDDGIEYDFEEGPFAKALKDSFFGPTYLIIEEINRGNAAAIFGDIFQLLDRKNGESEYSITNKDLYNYLVKNNVKGLEENKVYLPANLNILCTMNTADQNVFVLDTAFKRRFKMFYVPIDFNAYYDKNGTVKEECKGYLDNTTIFKGGPNAIELETLMGAEYKSVCKIIKKPERNWPTFAVYVNAKIDAINAIEQKISEDKKLGPFFVTPDELNDRRAFTDKVIYYLKQDVFKYEDNILTDSYEALYEDIVNGGKDIFEIFQIQGSSDGKQK